MLVKDNSEQETYIHVCPDSHKYRDNALKQRIAVYKHDISAYIVINGKLQNIKFCPYCGTNVEDEI